MSNFLRNYKRLKMLSLLTNTMQKAKKANLQ